MDCEHIKSNIPSFLTHGLSPEECHGMLRHMEGCAQCRHEVEELEKTWKLMDRWKIDEPPVTVKSGLMATVRKELQSVHIPWWTSVGRSFVFQAVLGALGLSMIIYLIFPYGKIINLCATNILKGGLLAFSPNGLTYFVLGLLYGLVPISISGICISKNMQELSWIKGLVSGAIFSTILVPFFIVQCPEFASGLIFTVALGMIFGALSGGTGTSWALCRWRMEEANV